MPKNYLRHQNCFSCKISSQFQLHFTGKYTASLAYKIHEENAGPDAFYINLKGNNYWSEQKLWNSVPQEPFQK